MKIRLTFKDPDHAVSIDGKDVHRSAKDRRMAEHYASAWVEFGEYVTIEIDTQDGSASVVPVEE